MEAGCQMSPPNRALEYPPHILAARSSDGQGTLQFPRPLPGPEPSCSQVLDQRESSVCILPPRALHSELHCFLASQRLRPSSVVSTQFQVTATDCADEANSLPPHQFHLLSKPCSFLPRIKDPN